MLEDGTIHNLNLKSIVYSGGYHFTPRIIDPKGRFWYHDGIETGVACIHQGYLPDMSPYKLRIAGEREKLLLLFILACRVF
jgi:hypothetical protein